MHGCNHSQKPWAQKAQVSVFIIIGILVIAFLAFLIGFKNLATEPSQAMPLNMPEISLAVEACIRQLAQDAIIYNGLQGGYYVLPEKSDSGLGLPYYYFDRRNIMPSIEVIEDQLALYIEDNSGDCGLSDMAYNVSVGQMDADVVIMNHSVRINADLPIAVAIGGVTKVVDHHSTELEAPRLLDIHGAIAEYMLEQAKDPQMICTSCIVKIAHDNDLYFEFDKAEKAVVFRVIDFNYSIAEPYTFIFANSYQGFDCNDPTLDLDPNQIASCLEQRLESMNYSFFVADVPDMMTMVNESVGFKVEAAGSGIKFSDDTDLFDINETSGEIQFVPMDEGNYTIWLTVKDRVGNVAYRDFKLQVKNE